MINSRIGYSKPKIFFYIPSVELVNTVPDNIKDYWGWINEFVTKRPVQLPTGRPCVWLGPYNWTIQTYMYLKAKGLPCDLTASFPTSGIIIAHGDFFPLFLKPSSEQFIVEIKPDRDLMCMYSNFAIVQNRHDPIRSGVWHSLIKSAFVNYWPQAGLIPRDPARGDRFEDVIYVGTLGNMLIEIGVLESEIKKLNLKLKMPPREKWHDYSEADAVVAVRPYDRFHKDGQDYSFTNRKPASKLLNAWAAGAPAILSPDSAFEDLQRSELDYLEARNVPEIVSQLVRLKGDPALRKAMVDNGKRRAEEFGLEQRIGSWIGIISDQVVPEYLRWQKSQFRRQIFYLTRIMTYKIMKTNRDFWEIYAHMRDRVQP